MSTCHITVVIPTYKRARQLLQTLDKILACSPCPDEIIIHIDAGDEETASLLTSQLYNSVTAICSSERVGPGGGRNKAIALAKNSIIASFDDDSYPIDSTYFQRLMTLFQLFPKAAVIGASIYHIDEPIIADTPHLTWTAEFIGCGCAYRKDIFQQIEGYVPLPIAYGMEEVDLALRLHHVGWGILSSTWLRVFHNTGLEHHCKPHISAASISNQALLAYLRYPVIMWWVGVIQCFSRIAWLIQHGRTAGIVAGLSSIPTLISRHHHRRQVVSTQSLISFLILRRNATAIDTQNYSLS